MKIPGLPRVCFVPVECKRFLLKQGCTKVGQEDVPRRRGRWKKFLVHSRSLFRSDLSLESYNHSLASQLSATSKEVIHNVKWRLNRIFYQRCTTAPDTTNLSVGLDFVKTQEVVVSRSQLLLALFSNFPTCIGVMANPVKVTEFDRSQHELKNPFSKTIVQLWLKLSGTAEQCNVCQCLV